MTPLFLSELLKDIFLAYSKGAAPEDIQARYINKINDYIAWFTSAQTDKMADEWKKRWRLLMNWTKAQQPARKKVYFANVFQ